MMDDRDVSDGRSELQRAAGAHLSRDFAETAWREGQRSKQRKGWAFGGGIAAAVTAIAMLGGPLAELTSSDNDASPAGDSADAPTSPETVEPTPTQSLDAQGLIPLGNGVAMRPIPGWQAIWVGVPGGDPGQQADFETCLQPEGEQISRIQCMGGVLIRTGTNRPEASDSRRSEAEISDLGVALFEGSPQRGTGDGPPGLPYRDVVESLVKVSNDVILDTAVLGETSITVGVLSGSLKEVSSVGTYEGEQSGEGGVAMVTTDETVTFTVSETTLCTEDNGSAAPARVIDCAELTRRIEANPDLAISVVYTQDDVLLRMSEDPRHYG